MKSSGSPSALLFALQNCNIRLWTCWHCAWHMPRGSVSNEFIVMLSHRVTHSVGNPLVWTGEATTRRRIGKVCFLSRSSSFQKMSAATLWWQFSLRCKKWHSRSGWAAAAVLENRNIVFTPDSCCCPFWQMPNSWGQSGKAALKFWGALAPVTSLLFI